MSSLLKPCAGERIPIAIGRSKLGPRFFRSAGARLTVILFAPGKENHEFFIALLTRSRLSCMLASQSPTMVKLESHDATSTSTQTYMPVSPENPTE